MKNFDAEYKKVWKTLAEIAEGRKKAAAEFAKQQKEAAAEFAKQQKEAAAEFAKQRAEFAKQRKEAAAESAKWREEADQRHRKLAESLRETNKNLGGYTNNEAERLEDEFYEGIRETMRVGDVPLKEVRRRQRAQYEYDLVGINGSAVFVGEIKQNLHVGDVKNFAEERLPHFAEDFPGIARRRKIFGMVGGGRMTPAAVAAAEKRGFLVLKLKNRKLIVQNAENAKPV
ncbi:MAG: hypothetical protein HAW59_03020 [Betaproteobacteria bacterium]|nr:hypothetical protein [Betaproteobacteria bacterium]